MKSRILSMVLVALGASALTMVFMSVPQAEPTLVFEDRDEAAADGVELASWNEPIVEPSVLRSIQLEETPVVLPAIDIEPTCPQSRESIFEMPSPSSEVPFVGVESALAPFDPTVIQAAASEWTGQSPAVTSESSYE